MHIGLLFNDSELDTIRAKLRDHRWAKNGCRRLKSQADPPTERDADPICTCRCVGDVDTTVPPICICHRPPSDIKSIHKNEIISPES